MPGPRDRPSGLPAIPRRYKTVLALGAAFVTFTFLLSGLTPAVPAAVREHMPERLPRPQVADAIGRLNPFHAAPAHNDALTNDSSASTAASHWHADWRWLQPFSSDVTHDGQRAVLPPARERPPIYTFYEPLPHLLREVREAEERLVAQWRRAWWAQGFRPVVLRRVDALRSPLYRAVQALELQDNIENELERWLAWGQAGGGVLVDWIVFPMAKYSNPLLEFLRRGRYPRLTRYEGLKNGIYCGDKAAVDRAIENAIQVKSLKQALDLSDVMFSKMFHIDQSQDAIARYDSQTISREYKEIAKPLFDEQRAKGLHMLGNLINGHLHGVFQNVFSEIVVLKPLAQHSTAMVDAALEIAGNLTSCPPSNPLQASCPPNLEKCRRCISSMPVTITTPPSIRNTTEKFFIGTVPHPYTTVSLTHAQADLDAAFVRRLGFKERDAWLSAITFDTLKRTSSNTISFLKAAIASEWADSHTLWHTAEDGIDQNELQYVFGFAIPHEGVDARDDAKSETPVPGPERRPVKPEDKDEGRARPEAVALAQEQTLLQRARRMLLLEESRRGGRRQQRVLEAVEGWNMGDAEIWRFVRAHRARQKMVRLAWQKDADAGSASSRWFDS